MLFPYHEAGCSIALALAGSLHHVQSTVPQFRLRHTLGNAEAAPPSPVKARISSTDSEASINSASAPASANAAARHRASAGESAWRASVRAIMTMSAPSSLRGEHTPLLSLDLSPST